MEAKKIKELIDDLFEDKFNTILIDGKWGIGKSYQIQQYFKDFSEKLQKKEKSNKNKVFIYLSLFGKETISEINQELFAKLHSLKNKVISITKVASTAVSLIGSSFNIKGANLAVAFPTMVLNKKVKKSKKNVIVFCDDLERVSSTLKYDALLGYLDELKRNGIKIGIICNSEEIDKDRLEEFRKFKEKFFTKEFLISEADRNVICQVFGEKAELLTEKHYELFNHNLRTVEKAKHFINLCLEELKKADKFLDENNFKDFIFYAIAVIKVCDNQLVAKQEIEANNSRKFKRPDLKEIYKYGDQIFAVTSNYGGIFFAETFLNALFYAYCELEYSHLIKYITKIQNSIFDKNLFLLSDDDKIVTITKQYEQLIAEDFKLEIINEIINRWFHFIGKEKLNTIIDIGILSTTLTDKIVSGNCNNFNLYSMFDSDYNNDYLEFKNDIASAVSEIENNNFKQELLKIPKDINSSDILKRFLNRLRISKQDISMWETFFEENKFLFPDISGTISEEIWKIAIIICNIVVDNFKSSISNLKTIINEQITLNPNDLSLKERGNHLISEVLVKP